MMVENLDLHEKSLYQIKAMLKQPDCNRFQDEKDKVLEGLREKQAALNPFRPDSKKMEEQITKESKPGHRWTEDAENISASAPT